MISGVTHTSTPREDSIRIARLVFAEVGDVSKGRGILFSDPFGF